MSANPAYDPDPDDPIEIVHVLPEEYHTQFRSEYAAAVDGARRPAQFHRFQDRFQEMLHIWRLRAIAYSSPGYDGRLAAALRKTLQTSSPRQN